MQAPLYEAWLERDDSYYSAVYAETIIKAFSQYGGGNNEGREGKGKMFGAGYEVFIYAFFIGLYSESRRPLFGPKNKFRMRMRDWGNVNPNAQKDRKKYIQIQQYIFMALVTKSDIDLLALDKGELSIDDALKTLMTTLNDYTNQGLHMIRAKMQEDENYFMGNTAFLDFLKAVINKEFVVAEDSPVNTLPSAVESETPHLKRRTGSVRWTIGEEKALLDYYNNGNSVEMIAVILDRDIDSVREKLVKKGIILP